MDTGTKITLRKNMKSSFLKEFLYVKAFLSEPITVKFPWGEEIIEPPKKLHISDLLFERTYSCIDYLPCKKCCLGLWSLFLVPFTTKESCNIIKPHAIVQNININGKDFEYLCVDHKGVFCPLNTPEVGCTIHVDNPITCMFPLIHFRQYRKDNVNILLGHFGRNWKLGCPVEFRPYHNVEEFNARVLPRFDRLIEYLGKIEVPHKGPEIMDYIYTRRDRLIGNIIPHVPPGGFGLL